MYVKTFSSESDKYGPIATASSQGVLFTVWGALF